MSRVSSVLIPLLTMMACSTGTEVKIGTTNTPPTVTLLSPGDGEQFDEFLPIYFQAKVSDTYDSPDDLVLYFSSDVQGDLLQDLPPLTATIEGDVLFSTANLVAGMHVITLTAVDTDGGQSAASVQVEIIDQPEAPVIEILRPTENDQIFENIAFGLMIEVGDARDDVETLPVTMTSLQDGEICQTNPDSNGLAECDALFATIGVHDLEFSVSNSHGFQAMATTRIEVLSQDYYDVDGDGFSKVDGDCDETDSTINPLGIEPNTPDGADNDCDGLIDEGTTAFDDDGDCYCELSLAGGGASCTGSISQTCSSVVGGDCDDGNPNISPSAQEDCATAFDDNCDNQLDALDANHCTVFYRDADNDTYGSPTDTECRCVAGGTTGDYDLLPPMNTDCYDGNANAYPGQTTFFSSDRGDGSFNYNCDFLGGSEYEEQEITTMGACHSWWQALWDNGGDCGVDSVGWADYVPSCGQSAGYLNNNDGSCSECLSSGDDCCPGGPTYASRIQKCR